MKRSGVKLFLSGRGRRSIVGKLFPNGKDPEWMVNRDFDLSLCCCSWRGLEGMYSIALVLAAPSPDLAGLCKAIEAGVPPSLLWP